MLGPIGSHRIIARENHLATLLLLEKPRLSISAVINEGVDVTGFDMSEVAY